MSVASAGEVTPSSAAQAPAVEVTPGARLGRVDIVQGAFMDASGNGGGTVSIRSGHLLVDQAFIFADTQGAVNGADIGVDLQVAEDAVITNSSFITADVLGTGNAGAVRLTAGSVEVSNRALIGSSIFSGTTGNGGNVAITAGSLHVQGGATISTAGAGEGRGGDLEVEVGRLLLTAGGQLNGRTSGAGQGSTLTITATDTISMTGRDSAGNASGLVNETFGQGAAGRLIISAPTVTVEGGLLQTGAVAGSTGNAGDILVQAARVTLREGTQIDSGTHGAGQAGSIMVTATEALSITERGNNLTGLFSNTFGPGAAGSLVIATPRLTLEGAFLQALSVEGSVGAAGAIDVRVGRLALLDGAQIDTSTRGSGQGGTLTVTATDAIAIAGRDSAGFPSGLFSNALGRVSNAGNAGDLTVSAPVLTMDGGRILANTSGDGHAGNSHGGGGAVGLARGGADRTASSSGSGQGGTLTVTATDAIVITGRDSAGFPSGLFSNALGRDSNAGNAGDLTVSAPVLTMDGGRILANTSGDGHAGNLTVEVGQLVLREGAQIDSSSSGSGQGGTVIGDCNGRHRHCWAGQCRLPERAL